MVSITKEEFHLLTRAKEGDTDAKEILFHNYEPMICKIARQFSNKNHNLSLYDDLYQSASEEFMYSIEKFDLEQRESTFFSYVYGNVVFKLRTFMEAEQQHFIYFPINVASKKSTMYRMLAKNPDLSDEELSKTLEIKVEMVIMLRGYLNVQLTYLDAPMKDALSDSFTGLEGLESTEQVEEKACYYCEREVFWDTVQKNLSPKEMDVIGKLYSDRPMTLEEVGNDYGVTREWIRQIKIRSFHKLEQSGELKNLAYHYLNICG